VRDRGVTLDSCYDGLVMLTRVSAFAGLVWLWVFIPFVLSPLFGNHRPFPLQDILSFTKLPPKTNLTSTEFCQGQKLNTSSITTKKLFSTLQNLQGLFLSEERGNALKRVKSREKSWRLTTTQGLVQVF
jgi:hypothetical protein